MAPVAFYFTKQEALSWFDRTEFTDVRIAWHNRNSWRITATKAGEGDGPR